MDVVGRCGKVQLGLAQTGIRLVATGGWGKRGGKLVGGGVRWGGMCVGGRGRLKNEVRQAVKC